jgi:hypothetical protein
VRAIAASVSLQRASWASKSPLAVMSSLSFTMREEYRRRNQRDSAGRTRSAQHREQRLLFLATRDERCS